MKVVHDPAIDMANIQLFLPEAIFKPGKILIADAQGRLMEQLSVQYFNQQFTLNLGDWSVGTYSVSLISNEKIIQVSKLNVIK